MVSTALVHIEDTVAGGGTEADTVEHRSLLEQAIGQGMTALGLPAGSFVGLGMLGPEVVITVGPERKEGLIAFLHGRKGTGGG
jgi:hypothetical protein